jgi:predicted transcriptional regulator
MISGNIPGSRKKFVMHYHWIMFRVPYNILKLFMKHEKINFTICKKVCQHTYLSTRRYLLFFVESGLITRKLKTTGHHGYEYMITEKGLKALQCMMKLDYLLEK